MKTIMKTTMVVKFKIKTKNKNHKVKRMQRKTFRIIYNKK
jgi:hypothetical protein